MDAEDIADMIAEIRELNPKPGLAFGSEPVQPVVPDVFVREGPDGGWQVELNSDTLPRLLVNARYYAKVSKARARQGCARTISTECLNNANWLVKSLDQRARTILKVASEIVRQQDGFLTYGVRHLRPLNLRTIADAIAMHESTVSRVTSNKYIATPRGLFELKYFFTASIQSVNGAESHCAEAVRDRIREMIENEERARNSVRRPHCFAADGGRREHRAPHRRQISRSHANPLLRGTPPAQGRQWRSGLAGHYSRSLSQRLTLSESSGL